MTTLEVLKVFVGGGGVGNPAGGNLLGVFLNGGAIPESERLRVAAELGFSETVFVDDPGTGSLRIFTPVAELPFAGHPLVGAAWLLRREGINLSALRPPAGLVPVRHAGGITYVAGRPEWAPPFEHVEYGSPGEVEALGGPPDDLGYVGAWAWEDESEGRIRARVFASALGVTEDEATGAYAVRLCAGLGRSLTIRQGVGSRIEARPLVDGSIEVGGRVETVEKRRYNT